MKILEESFGLPMKILFFSIIFVLPITLFGSDRSGDLSRGLEVIRRRAISGMDPEGFWPSRTDSGFSYEALTIATLYKLGILSEDVKVAFVSKLLSHRTNKGWALNKVSRSIDHDSTGLILISLKTIGFKKSDPRVVDIWAHFESSGGIRKMKIPNRLFLYMLEEDPDFPSYLIASPKNLRPHSVVRKLARIDGLGILNTIVPAVALFKFFQSLTGVSPVATIDSDVQRLVDQVVESQKRSPIWYINNFAIINLLALNAAQRAGVPGLTETIFSGGSTLMSMRFINRDGEVAFNPQFSTIWDTAAFLLGFLSRPELSDEDRITNSIRWLVSHQIPLPEEHRSGVSRNFSGEGWGYTHTDRSFPDTDDTAIVVEALLAFAKRYPHRKHIVQESIQKGVQFLVEYQNKDGGFPAFHREVDRLMYRVLSFLVSMDLFVDASQTDVTARVLRALTHVEESGIATVKNFDILQRRTCHFLYSRKSYLERFVVGNRIKASLPMWTGTWSAGFVYGTAEVLSTLLTSKCIVKNENLFFMSYMDLFKNIQNEDGGYGEKAFGTRSYTRAKSNILMTQFILNFQLDYVEQVANSGRFAATSISPDYLQSMHRAAHYLDQQLVEDSYTSSDLGYLAPFLPEQMNVNYENYPIYFGFFVLSRWQNARDSGLIPLPPEDLWRPNVGQIRSR